MLDAQSKAPRLLVAPRQSRQKRRMQAETLSAEALVLAGLICCIAPFPPNESARGRVSSALIVIPMLAAAAGCVASMFPLWFYSRPLLADRILFHSRLLSPPRPAFAGDPRRRRWRFSASCSRAPDRYPLVCR